MNRYFRKPTGSRQKSPKESNTRSSFGNTWWGQAWLQSLADIDDTNRLPRGKSYARQGLVQNIEIVEHIIVAKVQGTRPLPYHISIGVQRLDNYQKSTLVKAISLRSDLLSSLFSGRVPEEISDLCSSLGVSLFPRTWRDLSMQCSCPDWAVPCKHLAAVLYLLANEIDRDPLLIFRLHGIDLLRELEDSGFISSGEDLISVPHIRSVYENVTPDLPAIILDAYPKPDLSILPYAGDQLAKLLTPRPIFYPDSDLQKKFVTAYTSICKAHSRNIENLPPSTIHIDHQLVEFAEVILNDTMHWKEVWLYLPDDKEYVFTDLEELYKWLRNVVPHKIPFLCSDLILLHTALLLADRILEQGIFWPKLYEVSDTQFVIHWTPSALIPELQLILGEFSTITREGLITITESNQLWTVSESNRFIVLLNLFITREVLGLNNAQENSGFENKIDALFFHHRVVAFDQFHERGIIQSIQRWLSRLHHPGGGYLPAIQLVNSGNYLFSGEILVRTNSVEEEPWIPLEVFNSDPQFQPFRLALTQRLEILREKSEWLNETIKFQSSAHIPQKELLTFLKDTLPLLRWLGIPVLLPQELKGLVKPMLGYKAEINKDLPVGPSLFSLDELVQFDWQLAIGDQLLTVEEFRKLYKRGDSLIRIRDQYVFVEPGDMEAILNRINQKDRPSGMALFRDLLMGEHHGGSVSVGPKLMEAIAAKMAVPEIPIPDGLQATLRPYQERGFRWMYRNIGLAGGAVIADDMGLGKTIQIIALMLALKERNENNEFPFLVIAPSTLLGNWQREINKFGPDLTVQIYHGNQLQKSQPSDVILTTYGMIRSKNTWFKKQQWSMIVVDEAQAIKNPSTLQTKAVKSLESKLRIAMTGTPVENRLSDYWSILDFALPGYLGDQGSFERQYAVPIQQMRDQKKLDNFRRMVDPFVLRRMKTDPNIVPELPDKIEKDQFCTLTPEQTALYKARTESLQKILETDSNIQRQGLIFKLLINLKQICNHPAQYDKNSPFDPSRSGKSIRLLELLDEFTETGEQCLIFTQFREMADILALFIQQERNITPLMIHGGISRNRRDEAVQAFQSGRGHPVMIITIKAGGSGLNLTAASQVIHYDLWWNPAVEAQATDRAYRIGQKRNVIVHRLICKNTLEEKIDRLIQTKKELANLTVARGETWIGDMSSDEIREIVLLGS